MAAKLRNALELEKSGAFQYLCADVSNSEALQSALESLERSHGRPVDGIIHLAAVEKLQSQLEVIDQHRVFRESVAQFEFSFSAKAYGLCNLYKLVRHRPDTVVVVSSSVNSLFSSPGLGAYCAAGSLVDALAASMQTRSHRNTFTVNWSMWDGIGMTAGTSGFVREMSRERGFDVLAPNQAVNSLLAALRTPVHQVLIGVNGQSPAFREVASGHAFPLETVEVFCEAANATAAVRAAINPFQDRFGSALYPVIHVVDRVPVVDGVVDLAALRAQSSPGGDTRRREPETAYEREVAELWCELLDVPQCYLDDRFFEIGGDSLLAIRLLNRVESKFGCRLPLQVLFEDPTVATMAAQIGRMKFEAPAAVALPTTEPETLLENLQSLSESEIDKLLARMAAGQN
jgi:NAD(P)-dependent dehydrogenase (short-subunit alcohol dehydrogenase family)/acyl carrier protein